MKNIEKYWLYIFIAFVIAMFIKPIFCALILGSLLFSIGIMTISFLRKIHKSGVECTGTILSYESDDEGYKTPIVEFVTSTGEKVSEKPFVYASSDLSKLRAYKDMINQNVIIIYDPDNPRQFVLKDEKEFNYFVLILCVLGGLFFIGLFVGNLLGYVQFN
jgi:hypothetical protein